MENTEKPKLSLVKDTGRDLNSSTADVQKKPLFTVTDGGGQNPANPYAGKGPIKLVRLITGEVLIGYVKPNGNFSSFVTSPLLIVAQVDPRDANRISIQMMPYMMFSKDETFEFNQGNILNVCNPAEGLEAEYRSKTSGIIIPPSGIIQ